MSNAFSTEHNAYYHYSHMTLIRELQLKVEALENLILNNGLTTDFVNYKKECELALSNDKDYVYSKSMMDAYRNIVDP